MFNVSRRASAIDLPRAARGRVLAMAADDGIQALTRAFDVQNAESTRTIQALSGSLTEVRTEVEGLSERFAALSVSGGGTAAAKRRDPKYAALADFARSKKAGQQYFGEFLASSEIHAAATIGSDPDGGFTAIPDFQSDIIRVARDVTPMRALARIRPTTRAAVELLVDPSQSGAAWVGETEARPETQNAQLKLVTIQANEIYAMPKASQNLLDDSATDIMAWLTDSVGTAFAIAEGTAFISGDGVNKPAGILSFPTDTAADFTRTWGRIQYLPTLSATPTDQQLADALIKMSLTLRAPYRANATWLMARDTVRTIRQLRDGQARPLFSTDGRITGDVPETLLGFPIAYSEDMPAIAANAFAIALGDFRAGYTIVDRLGIRMLRDPYTAKPYVMFYTTKRVGGAVVDFNAIKLLKWATS